MVLFSEMFVSELIGDPVVDRVQENIGRVKDIIITLGDVFPRVTGLLVILAGEKKEEKVILLSEIDLIGRQFVSTRATKDRVPFTRLRDGEVLLQRDVIDQQVVDLEGARVLRVNDLQLAKVDMEVRLIAADVGFRGMVRRLGLEGPAAWLAALLRRPLHDKLIGWDHVQSLSGGKITIPTQQITDLHPADVAQIISQVQTDKKAEIFSSLTEKTAAEALHELEPVLGALLIQTLDTKKALGVLEKMPVDEVADIIGDLPGEKADELLRLMRVRKAAEIRKLLKHRDETAGGLMTTEFISLALNLTVEEVITQLRQLAPNAETIYYLYVVDNDGRLAGVISLRSLIVAQPHLPVSEVMIKEPIVVAPEMNEREVADVFSKYNLLAVPVVDAEGRIQGIITIDDVMDLVLPPMSRRKRLMVG
ncbi:MAG: CBS domain-containing protein [Candidatus Margulisbacteria bacterium]|jgi:CBS domain-containing protein|nr:CBS domain-containing protein [Candidatus Margulisiibacteriota bacterium]